MGDFNLMKAIAECLTQTGISYPLLQLRTLYQKFRGLSRELFNNERNAMQRIGSPQLGNDLLFDQFAFTGAEGFSGMLSLPEIDPSLPYSFD
ncbi:hypothetical protein PENNAL_c0014G10767 [Penicillium nalgiovense]|uniref:Uncharacterized protein n=1 Tax=Penicillium nalgiovense TaxID=60175 RepID=A0A1V6YPW5_PENNA|nr:hypothetical protein PENNAL_c0014G10767 [Penicillium nalgiovense]